MKTISILSTLFFCTLAFGKPQRVDVPFKTECVFSGLKASQVKTYESVRVMYPFQESKWWTAISETSFFNVDDVFITDLFIQAFDYKSEGSKSILQTSVVINGVSQTLAITGKNPNKTETLEFYGKNGKILEVSCNLK